MENKYKEYCQDIIENCASIISETGNKDANLIVISANSLSFDLFSESIDFKELRNIMLVEYNLYIVTDLINLFVLTVDTIDIILLNKISDLYRPSENNYLN